MAEKKTQVDQNICIGCAMCVSLCPRVYTLDDTTGKALILENNGFSEVSQAELDETITECPVGAISYPS